MILGKTNTGKSLNLNVQRLIETRLLLQANSGGGKSWALRRILEQTHGDVQQIVIDVEDEFHTLREKYDYVLGLPLRRLSGRYPECRASRQETPRTESLRDRWDFTGN